MKRRPQFPSQPDRSCDIHTRGHAEVETFFLQKSEGDVERLLIWDAVGMVNFQPLKIARNATLTNAFGN